jgi:hypothetical protein
MTIHRLHHVLLTLAPILSSHPALRVEPCTATDSPLSCCVRWWVGGWCALANEDETDDSAQRASSDGGVTGTDSTFFDAESLMTDIQA